MRFPYLLPPVLAHLVRSPAAAVTPQAEGVHYHGAGQQLRQLQFLEMHFPHFQEMWFPYLLAAAAEVGAVALR